MQNKVCVQFLSGVNFIETTDHFIFLEGEGELETVWVSVILLTAGPVNIFGCFSLTDFCIYQNVCLYGMCTYTL